MFKKLIASLLHISDGKEYAFDADTGRWITVHPNGAGEGNGRKIHLDENGRIDSNGPLAEALKAKSVRGDSGMRFSPSNPDIRYSIPNIYTGSSADYDKPSLMKIGTGEGGQVYGWGLYGSGVRGVAETYSHRKFEGIFKNGQRTDIDNPKTIEDFAAKCIAESDGSAYGAIVAADRMLVDEEIDFDKNESIKEEIEKSFERYEVRRSPAYLYSQTFFTNHAPGDESHLLRWYEPVSEENLKRVKSRAKKEGIDFNSISRKWKSAGNTANLLYRAIESHFADGVNGANWSDAARLASEFLARADIDGVKYPVDSYGGKPIKDGDEVGWNYVSFRDDNIEVDRKWRDWNEVPVANNRNTTRAMVDVLNGWIPGIEVSEVDEGDVIKNGNNERYSLILGEKGAARLDNAVNDLENLKVAKKMVNGKAWDTMSREEKLKVKVATGWEKGKDGKWRREAMDLPDVDYDKILGRESDDYKAAHEAEKKASNEYDRLILSPDASDEAVYAAKMRRDAAKKKLNEVRETSLYVPSTIGELYGETSDIVKAYPSLAGIKVGLFKGDGIVNGGRVAADKNGNVLGIFLPNGLLNDPVGIKDSITHEIQHVIQVEEGFGVGGNIGVGKEIEKRDEKARRERIRISDELYRNEKEELDNLVQKHGKKEDLNNLRKAYFGSSESMTKEEYEEKKRKILDSIPGYREKEQDIDRAREERDKKDEALQEVYTRRKGYGNSLFAGTSGYARIAGEVEARNAGRRTQADRVTIGKELLEDTEDVSREDQVVIKDLQEALSIVNAAESGNGGGVGSSVRQMTHHGKVAGWYDRNTGKVALVKGVATPATVAHEIGWHATFHWAEKNHPALHKKLLQYAKEAPEGIEKSVKEKYGTNLTPNELLDEIGAERFTREDISPLLDKAQKTASEQFFDRVENEQDNVRRAFVKANSALSRKELDEIAKLPPKEAVVTLVQKMLEGRTLGGEPACKGKGAGNDGADDPLMFQLLKAIKRISIGTK